MKKIFKRKKARVSEYAGPDTTAFMDEIRGQLISLEKKLDILIGASSVEPSERPFRRERSSGSFRSFDRHRRHDRERQDNRFSERSFTQVVCAECGKDCEVPFRPSSDRPVYCKDCFAKRKGDSPFRDRQERSFRDDDRKPDQGFYPKKKRFPRRRK